MMGNGRREKFWIDRRRRESSLEESLPVLFSIATNKDSLMADIWEQDREEGW